MNRWSKAHLSSYMNQFFISMNDELVLKLIKDGGRLYNKTINNNLELKNYLNNRY